MEDYKLVKHAAPRKYSYNDSKTVIHVKSSTPFMSAVKRIDKTFGYYDSKYTKKGKPIPNENKNVGYITVRGMGKTILKVMNLALYFEHEQNRKVEVFTKTLTVLDELKSTNKDKDDVFQKRQVSCVELRIHFTKS
ncbi:hypothetical protein OGAPHI_002581 [Ogataea philodendri]|uniref:Uncharacterized protein n=1 Tax=Ogataea philodendri TaxID=1378263 RepID=A0A9P8T8B2_9ASCO|nr:uncharacterized protein OGAPHI_002581 [Ogataea philodendri]KAH3668826.1 hypothetical protein OGAPHI_002581 [Ogataea philodendri]